MCRESQSFYRCNCPPPPPTVVLCEAGCREPHGKTLTWTANLCQACTYRQQFLTWFSHCWDYRLTGGVPPGQPPSHHALQTLKWLQNSEQGPRLEQYMATMQHDIAAWRTKGAKMLTIEEMLNPMDEQAVFRRSVNNPSIGRVLSVEETTKEGLEFKDGLPSVAVKAGLFPSSHERSVSGLQEEAIRMAVVSEKYRKPRSPGYNTVKRCSVHKRRP